MTPVVIKSDEKHLEVTQSPAGMHCDFCNDPGPTEAYDAPDFVMGAMIKPTTGETYTHNSVGAWASCTDCATLIDAGDWDGLLERVMEKEIASRSFPVEAQAGIRETLRRCYARLKELGVTKRK